MLAGSVGWPAATTDHYRRQGHWRGRPLGSILRDPARGSDAIALVTPQASYSYSELSDRADRLAAGFHLIGIEPLDRVLVQLPNTIDFVLVCIALFRLGALPVLVMPGLRSLELTHLAKHTEATAAVMPAVHQEFDHRELARGLVKAVPSLRTVVIAGDAEEFTALSGVDAAPSDLPGVAATQVAFFLLSGGTTNLPKLIPRTHDDYAHQMRATAAEIGFGSTSAYVAALPVAHNAALGCPGILGALQAGATAILAPSPSPDDAFPLITAAATQHPLVVTTLMPSLLPVWLEAARVSALEFPSLVVEVGGSIIDVDTVRDFDLVLKCRTTRWFGMAEGPLCFTRPHDPIEYRLANEGHPLSLDDEYVIVGAADQPLPPGEVGELLVRGPTTLRGYYREPDYNRITFTSDGFLRTGDLASRDVEGALTIHGRINDVINRGGEKVPAAMVECKVLEHPAVKMCTVTGIPDPLLIEKVAAFIVPAGVPPTLAELTDFLNKAGLAPHCLPEHIVVLDRFPMTDVGKVDKNVLQRHFASS